MSFIRQKLYKITKQDGPTTIVLYYVADDQPAALREARAYPQGTVTKIEPLRPVNVVPSFSNF